ncbi:MAG: hypothetical protein R2837_10610 [Aliarcobacter sp.]
MTYEVIIRMLGEVEFKGLFSLHNNKIYIRSLIDKEEYEEMFKQLINNGYVSTEKNENDYNVNVIEFQNSLENIFDKVQEKGIELSFEQIDNEAYTFSVVADGEDLNPQVIAHLNKGTKIIGLGETLFKYANNVDYEPKINIRASSYAVDIQEINNDDNRLIELIESINEQNINVQQYLTDTLYSNAIHSVFDVVGIETLDTLKINLRNGREIVLDINTIKNLKRNFKTMLSGTEFLQENINATDLLRAFDNKKYKVTLDIKPIYYLHFDDENIFRQLKDSHDENKIVTIRGSYKSKQTIQITSVIVH